MKVLFEVPVEAQDSTRSLFTWLSNEHNWFFIIEDGKRMKTLSSNHEPGKELHSATLTETRVCTSLCWNKDGTLLALVVDKKQIYFWDIRANNFTHFKPNNNGSTAKGSSSRRGKQAQEIELIHWCKVSNKFALVYSTGQILLCNCDNNFSERFIDNSDGVLKKITSFESCAHTDLFVCISEISEILVMTFDGEARLYIQNDDYSVVKAKFSPIKRDHWTSGSSDESVWLAMQSGSGRLLFKKISLTNHDSHQSAMTNTDVTYTPSNSVSSRLINFFWLSFNQLVASFASGQVDVIRINQNLSNCQKMQLENKYEVSSGKILDISCDGDESNEDDESGKANPIFTSYELVFNPASESSALAAISDHKLYYYELFCDNQCDNKLGFTCEKVDQLDLSASLTKVGLELAKIKWSPDCSMLAVQLSNNHILVYRTRLQDYMVCTHGGKSAYLSAPNEITILNYGNRVSDDEIAEDNEANEWNSNALTINVKLKPSVISIGPNHLAVALNNRVQFYHTSVSSSVTTGDCHINKLVDEQEYASIVVAIQLSSRFVAVHFDDGRLKLHAMQLPKLPDASANNDDLSDLADERFFPDPTNPEQISAFCLNENTFLYSTRKLSIHVFSLSHWTTLQSFDHSEQFDWPVSRLRANNLGNKFICMAADKVSEPVFIYDLYTNKTVSCFGPSALWSQILDRQVQKLLERSPDEIVHAQAIRSDTSGKVVNQILDAIWDTDGRTALLIEQKCIHVVVVLDHTLESEGPVVEYVAKSNKPSSYTALYASHGIVSFQTALGRIINTVLESHDDESKLGDLELRIKLMNGSNTANNLEQKCFESTRLKLDYLSSVLPIYSLSRCKEICEHLTTLEETSQKVLETRDENLWQLLAAWALFTINPEFALMIYRKHGPAIYARALRDIARDAHTSKARDSKAASARRFLKILDCDQVNHRSPVNRASGQFG